MQETKHNRRNGLGSTGLFSKKTQPILGYVPKNDEKRNSGSKELMKFCIF